MEWTGRRRRRLAWHGSPDVARLGSSLQRQWGRRASSTTGRKVPSPRLSEEQLDQFAKIVEAGPDRARMDGIVRWRRVDLKRVIAERFGVDFHPRYVGKLLKKLGFCTSAPGRVIRLRTSGSSRGLKKLPARAESSSRRVVRDDADRNLVPGRSPDRPEERPRPPVGQARNETKTTRRSALRQRSTPVRRDLPSAGRRSGLGALYADSDMMQLHLDEISSSVAKGAHAVVLLDRAVAHHQQARHARKHHTDLPAFSGPGVEPGRERLAVSPSELDLKHRLRKLRRHCRRCLRRMAETDRPARNDHLHRNARPPTSVSRQTFGISSPLAGRQFTKSCLVLPTPGPQPLLVGLDLTARR